jgi:hypothetical protein
MPEQCGNMLALTVHSIQHCNVNDISIKSTSHSAMLVVALSAAHFWVMVISKMEKRKYRFHFGRQRINGMNMLMLTM